MRFYFDVKEKDSVSRDEEGMDCPNADTAVSEATRTAMAMGQDVLPSLPHGEVRVCVRDEGGQSVAEVSVTLTVERFAADASERSG